MTLPRPDAVLFDWDNTLVDTWPVIHRALHITFTEMGHEPWTLEQVRQNVRQSLRDSFPQLFGEEWERAGDIYIQSYKSLHLEHLKPLPGAQAMLETLKTKGVYTAVVSNKRGDTLRKEVEHLGWNGYFSALVGSTDAAHDKPHPAPAELALNGTPYALGASVWYVGDSDIDMELAKATGMSAVFYGPEALREGGFVGAYPYQIGFTGHADLQAHFSRILE
jgi:phosphoglycolate phosphatase